MRKQCNFDEIEEKCLRDEMITAEDALTLTTFDDLDRLCGLSTRLRDKKFRNVVTYSKKVFIPLTKLCRDVCHYCTFAQTPKKVGSAYMSVEEVLQQCRVAEEQGCKEALFTLGEKPELRYAAAREALEEMGFKTTLEYVAHVAERVMQETNLLPHINAGCMTDEEIELLRPVSASMGLMLESSSQRLCEKGMPHYGSPDKDPKERLATIDRAGALNVPMTSGILIGIGETREERIQSLLDLRDSHHKHGHIQEIIVQNFKAKPDTKMAGAPEPDLDDLVWTIAVARLILGSEMSIQAPPNLSPGELSVLINAGINDWGGVSPLTPDFVNPEAPWPHIKRLSQSTREAGKFLRERLTIYPDYVLNSEKWLDATVWSKIIQRIDASGYPKTEKWRAGELSSPPTEQAELLNETVHAPTMNPALTGILEKAKLGTALSESEIVYLFNSRGDEFRIVCDAADELRRQTKRDVVTYAINRNINYTNVCYFKCKFCAFSKGRGQASLRGAPYDLDHAEIARRVKEAWSRGGTEVCMQGGIHPDYTGQTYLEILDTVKDAVPEMHVHAFSPLEISQGAQTLNLPVPEYLKMLKAAGLGSLPGTAAEVLDDEVRAILCPDKINSQEWLDVMEAAHNAGLRSTATMMFGHVDYPRHWARHLLKIRALQKRTGGFTEFVPLPFVASQAPIYMHGNARSGPSYREAVLVHAIARIVLHGVIDNIQVSWVKMGLEGLKACLNAGANDVGGTLMNESITRSAGAKHGQEWSVRDIQQTLDAIDRTPQQRSTLYRDVERCAIPHDEMVAPLAEIVNTPVRKRRNAVELSAVGN